VGIGGAVVVDEDGGELVAPSRPATPGRADVVGDAVCGRLQQRVPGRVPVGVVDVLELVDVGTRWVRRFLEHARDEPEG
jgi:hypothetical protein